MAWTRCFCPRAVALSAFLVMARSAMVTLKALPGKIGATKVLIVINGALVPNTDYTEVAQAIQKASSLKLWVGIPSFLLNTPNPGQIDGKITDALAALSKAGCPPINNSADVVVAGHSLGGIFSQSAVVKGDYAGLVLLGSYLTSINGYAVDKYPKPAFTLAGELDGLTRITRIARSWAELQSYIIKAGEESRFSRAVVALPGQTHSQFCSDINVTSFGLKDKCPEVSLEVAHAAIGDAVSAFMAVLFKDGDVSAARNALDNGMSYTKSLVGGFLTAQEMETGPWCATAQQLESDAIHETLEINVTRVSSWPAFEATNPSIGNHQVTVVGQDEHSLNPGDLSTLDMAAKAVKCKVKTAAALAKAFGKPPPAKESSACKDANQAAIAQALNLVTGATATRYKEGVVKPLAPADDVVYTTGVTWEAGSVDFEPKDNEVSVTSPRLTEAVGGALWGGDQLCKYVSPARVIEYMMVDGLPAFDQCPKSSALRAPGAEVFV